MFNEPCVIAERVCGHIPDLGTGLGISKLLGIVSLVSIRGNNNGADSWRTKLFFDISGCLVFLRRALKEGYSKMKSTWTVW